MEDKRCKDCECFSNLYYYNKDYGKCCKKDRTVYRLSGCNEFIKLEKVNVKPTYPSITINKEDVKRINTSMEEIKKKWDDVIHEVMKKQEDKEPYYVQEIYKDEHRTLGESIIFKIDDAREASYLRSTINPNLKLVDTIYLNKDFKMLEEE